MAPFDEAEAARSQSYSPYSGFAVGAALVTKSGHVYRGANVENVSFSLTMCAERVCVGTAVQNGDREFELLVLVTNSRDPVVPCGACRQVLAEFAPRLRILSRTDSGIEAEFNLEELLPRPNQGILG